MSAVRKPTPAQLAGEAFEAIRAINQQTIRNSLDGYEWPSDVFDTVLQSARTVQGLQQALEQAGRWLQKRGHKGLVGVDAEGRQEDLPRSLAGLMTARDAAALLYSELDEVAQRTAHLTSREPVGGGSR